MQQNLPKLPPNLQSLVNPNELPAVYVRNPFPNGIDALISGINNQNLNYGNKNLLDLEKRMSKQDITAGLQKGLNFGIPEIAQAQQTSPYHFANNTEVLPQDAEIPATRQVGQPIETPAVELGASKQRPKVFMGLQDLADGFKENANTPFQLSNLEDTKTPSGQDKGFLYHLGEGLGTAGRFANSPAGRMALTGLAVGATGGNPTQAMTYGLQAGLGNYNNVQQDKMNRNLLQQQGIDTSNIRGYLNNDMASAYTKNYNMLNNANYRNGRLNLAQIDQLRKAGLTEAQIRKLDADTEYTEGAKTDKTEAETGLIKEKTATEPIRRETMLHPPVKKTISYKSGHTVVDINHNSNGKSGGSPKTKTSTPKPTSGDYYF